MTDLSAFPITRKWPAKHPDRLQLYSLPTPNGVKVSIMLEETGLPYEVHRVAFDQNDQTTPEFLSLSPNNKIPAIVDPEGPAGRPISVFESGAILIYLAEKTGRFMPADPVARVAALEWLMFQMGSFGPIPGQVHHFVALKDETERRYGLERFMAETRRLYGVMDRRLAGNAFFAGEPISIADFAILGWAWRHERHQVDLADYPNVKRWYDAMMAREGVQRGFAVPLRRPS